MVEQPAPPLALLLRAAGIVLVVVGIAMLIAPSAIATLFGLDVGAGGEFMTRRYGAAGMVGLGVALWLATGRTAPSAVLGGVAAWFFVQGGVAIVATLSGTISGVAWVTVLADPILGVASLLLARRL